MSTNFFASETRKFLQQSLSESHKLLSNLYIDNNECRQVVDVSVTSDAEDYKKEKRKIDQGASSVEPSGKFDVNSFCLMFTYFYLKSKISRIK